MYFFYKALWEEKEKLRIFAKWFGTLGIGLLGNWIITKGFDLVLYPFVIYLYGILWGGVIMMFLSFVICYATIIFYDWAKIDWIGIETLKGIKNANPKKFIGRFIVWIAKKSDPIAMIFLSIYFDPFITVAYMRHGAHRYDGLSARDWKIFISSLVISNVYWTLTVYLGITIIEGLWLIISSYLFK